jgi:DNA-binding NarL/FixJ family response regulator
MTPPPDGALQRLSTPGAIRVAIVEDRDTIREGLATLIDGTEGFACVDCFRSMEDALSRVWRSLPHVVLNDIALPGMSGIEGISILKARYPSILVLMLTIYDDDDRIFDAICAGASGYLLKKTPPARLLDSIREAVEGGAPMSPDVARRVIATFRATRPSGRADHDLTPHEIRVLRLFVEGHNYKTAAAELSVSVHAVSFHLRSIYAKLHVHSKTEAVAKALRHGFV